MPSEEDIKAQQELLNVYRRTLFTLLKQRAYITASLVPPAIASGIDEARDNIRRIKQNLRAMGISIDDQQNDDEAPAPPLVSIGSVSFGSTNIAKSSNIGWYIGAIGLLIALGAVVYVLFPKPPDTTPQLSAASSPTVQIVAPSSTPSVPPAATPTIEPTARPTATIEPTARPTATSTAEPTKAPTEIPVQPTATPLPTTTPTKTPIPCDNVDGTYRRSFDGALMTITQTGCVITGRVNTDHDITGHWNSDGYYNVTIDRHINGCDTQMVAKLFNLSNGDIRLQLNGTDGNCDLARDFSEDYVWSRQ